MTLKGKKILLGMTGGIAAYKAAELTRLLVKAGADVRVAMTEAATRFVGTATMQALSGQPVWTDLWDSRVSDAMGHIELSRDRDLILIAPASADFMAKLAHGYADDLLSTLCVARRCPLMVAPAMNVEMWQNAATARNAETLRADGVTIVGPASGGQACGEMGMGRMTEPADILADVQFFQPKRLAGRRVVVTAGPTEEPVDPVRVLTNTSSGKMGYAVARAAREAGRRRDADQRPGVAADAGGRGARRRAHRARDVRRGEEGREARRRVHLGGRGRRLPRQEARGAEDQEGERRTSRSSWRRTRTSSPGSPGCRSRRSASASPPRARTWRRTRKRSWRRRSCR